LKNISPYVDEIVAVDGSVLGPSTDSTADILKSFDSKVKYKAGKFISPDGGWDISTQRNTAITMATGDILLFLSADMFFVDLGRWREVIDGQDDYKLFFCSTVEFWQDTSHVRLYSPSSDLLTIPSTILQVVSIERKLRPVFNADGSMRSNEARLDERLLMPCVIKYHLGWIRPFQQQVDKHIRHVKQRRWGEHGDALLRGKDRDLELWAILHVLGYNNTPSIPFVGPTPPEMSEFANLKYTAGYEAVAAAFEQKYGVSVLQMQTKLGMGTEEEQ